MSQVRVEHWMFVAKLTRLTGSSDVEFVRLIDRAGRGIFEGAKPYGDFDFGGSLSKYLNRDIAFRSELFVRQLGYGFPTALLGPQTATKILNFELFPSYDDWVRKAGEDGYSQEQYRYDSNLWWRQKITIKSFEELLRWLARVKRSLTRKLSPQDRGAYARMVLSTADETLCRLRAFYPKDRWVSLP